MGFFKNEILSTKETARRALGRTQKAVDSGMCVLPVDFSATAQNRKLSLPKCPPQLSNTNIPHQTEVPACLRRTVKPSFVVWSCLEIDDNFQHRLLHFRTSSECGTALLMLIRSTVATRTFVRQVELEALGIGRRCREKCKYLCDAIASYEWRREHNKSRGCVDSTITCWKAVVHVHSGEVENFLIAVQNATLAWVGQTPSQGIEP